MKLTMRQRGFITLFGGFFVEINMGAVFLWGSLNVYITSYFRQKDDGNLNLGLSGVIFPIMMVCFAIGIPIGIAQIKVVGSARIQCIISSIIASTMCFLSSYTQRFWQFTLCYGVIQAIAQGCNYFVPLYMCYLYFPNNKGFVAGIITGGFALCSFIYGMIFKAIVNPENLSLIKNSDGYSYFEGNSIAVAYNVPNTLKKISFISLGVSLFGSLFILYHPNQIGEEEKKVKIKTQRKRNKIIIYRRKQTNIIITKLKQ